MAIRSGWPRLRDQLDRDLAVALNAVLDGFLIALGVLQLGQGSERRGLGLALIIGGSVLTLFHPRGRPFRERVLAMPGSVFLGAALVFLIFVLIAIEPWSLVASGFSWSRLERWGAAIGAAFGLAVAAYLTQTLVSLARVIGVSDRAA